MKPIGTVKTELSDEEVRRRWPSGLEAEVEVFEEFEEGLRGIEDFSHLIIIFFMHKVGEDQRKTLLAKPRRLAERCGIPLDALPLVGVFCLDSPHRPNPIGLTIVELIERRGRVLRVKGLDAFNGTPVLDIKPYTPERCVEVSRLPKWYSELVAKLLR